MADEPHRIHTGKRPREEKSRRNNPKRRPRLLLVTIRRGYSRGKKKDRRRGKRNLIAPGAGTENTVGFGPCFGGKDAPSPLKS